MIDSSAIGQRFGPYRYRVEPEQIRSLAALLGLADPVYHEPEAARLAGWADLPAPPTLLTCYGVWANRALLRDLDRLGAPLERMLHGEQQYAYMAPVVAGDELTAVTTLLDCRQRQGSSGPLELLTLQTEYRREHDELCVAVEQMVIVLRADA